MTSPLLPNSVSHSASRATTCSAGGSASSWSRSAETAELMATVLLSTAPICPGSARASGSPQRVSAGASCGLAPSSSACFARRDGSKAMKNPLSSKGLSVASSSGSGWFSWLSVSSSALSAGSIWSWPSVTTWNCIRTCGKSQGLGLGLSNG